MVQFFSSLNGDIQYEYITRSELSLLVNETPNGGVLNLGNKIVLFNGSRFYINKDITFLNGGFKRADTPVSLITAVVNIGDDSYEVEDANVFIVGNNIQIVYGQGNDESAGITGVAVISDITGNIITTAGNSAIRTAPIGSTMIISHILLEPNAGNTIIFDRCIFDGNKTGNSYTYDWKQNALFAIWNNHIVRNCNIINTSGEALFVKEGSIIENNRFSNLNGSFVHTSNAADAVLDTYITGNVGDGVCLVPRSVNGHNEGAITFSAHSQRLIIEDNIISNGGESCYGGVTVGDDFDIWVKNNKWNNLKSKVYSGVLDTSLDSFINVPDGN